MSFWASWITQSHLLNLHPIPQSRNRISPSTRLAWFAELDIYLMNFINLFVAGMSSNSFSPVEVRLIWCLALAPAPATRSSSQTDEQWSKSRHRWSSKSYSNLKVRCNKKTRIGKEIFRVNEIMNISKSCQGGNAGTVTWELVCENLLPKDSLLQHTRSRSSEEPQHKPSYEIED
jgi:hypothetical protein